MGDAAMSAERPVPGQQPEVSQWDAQRQAGGIGSPNKPITEARNLLAAHSILSQTIQSEYLPPERFRGEIPGYIVEIRKIGETVAVLRKCFDTGGKNEHYEATVFDGRGNSTAIKLDVTGDDLVEANSGRQYVAISPENKGTSDTKPWALFKKFGFGEVQSKKLTEVFYSKVSPYRTKMRFSGTEVNYITNEDLAQEEIGYIQAGHWELGTSKLTLDSSTGTREFEGFIFQAEGQGFAIDPTKPSQKFPVEDVTTDEILLDGGLTLKRGNTVFSVNSPDGRELASYTGINPLADPINPNGLVFINAGRIYELDLSGVANRSSTPKLVSQVQIPNIQEFQIDPNGNFFIVRTSDKKLHIVDRHSGDISTSFDGIMGPILVDKQGDILVVDDQAKLREIQTNFQAIPPGGSEAARERRDEELRQMQERFANLELGKVQRQKGEGITESDVAQTLRETISKQVTDSLAQAAKPEEIEDIMDRLQGLKADLAYQAYGEVVDEFIGQARDKLSGIRVAELDRQLAGYQQALDEVKTVGDTIGLDEQFAKLLDLRQKIDVTDPQKRREIEQQLRGLQAKKDGINTQYQGELLKAIDETLPQIAQLVKETGSPQELAYFSSSTQAQQFEMMLANVKDPQARRVLRERYNGMRAEQRGKLEERSNQLAEQDRLRWAQVVEEAREDLGSLQEQIATLSDAREIDRFDRNPLVTAWRAKLFALPPELREIEEKRLEIILGARKKDMEHRKELGAVGEAGELKFGNATFPIYKEPPRIWQPKFVPIKGGLDLADLVFEDIQGRVWKPDGDQRTVVTPDMSDERTQRIVKRYREQADEYFKGLKRKVPEFDEHWRITDYHMEKLEEIAEALNLQLDNHRGILILQGEAGTGKNVLVDMLANLSNREVITVACNENSAKEDLTYEFYFEPGRGTYKLPSRLVEGIQTSGAIVLFDEINALKPGIAKMLNALFDYRRRIFQTEGGSEKEIIADPTVLFVATMNPQNYAGVNRLSPEVKSRSRVIDLDYPPFEMQQGGRTRYRSDEAEMLAGYMDNLSELKQKEFKQVWDYIINRDTTNGAGIIIQGNSQLETDVRRVYDVIRVANKLREMYEAYQAGDSNEPFDFPTSLRDVIDIVMEMNHRQGVKPMIKRVIIPKIDDRRQKRLVDSTIEAVLPNPIGLQG